jgi:hypothetical protein
MLRLLMIGSGTLEVLFGLSALVAPNMLVASLGTTPDASSVFLARILGAATLGLGVAALLARDELNAKGGLPQPTGLGSTTCSPRFSSRGRPWSLASAGRRSRASV